MTTTTGAAPMGAWTLYSEQRPQSAGVYEWRVPSKALPGMVIIVAAHMRERGAGYSRALSPTFDYWDGYQLHVPNGISWRSTEDHAEVKEHSVKVVSIEGLDPCDCIYCGRKPTIEAYQRYNGGGFVIGADPWNLNSWNFNCCTWGNTPTLSDPREIERIRRTAVSAMAEREAALIAERDALVKEVEALRAAYHKARNAAAGFSNYCPESANSRRCERDLDEAERMFRAIDAARAEARYGK